MFADTITITINAVAKVLLRVNQDKYSSEYLLKEADRQFQLRIRHSSYIDKTRASTKVDRHNVELTETVFSTPTVPQVNRKAYVVLENDSRDVMASAVNFDLGFAGFLTNANLTKMFNWES